MSMRITLLAVLRAKENTKLTLGMFISLALAAWLTGSTFIVPVSMTEVSDDTRRQVDQITDIP